jgi:hypothetical protein
MSDSAIKIISSHFLACVSSILFYLLWTSLNPLKIGLNPSLLQLGLVATPSLLGYFTGNLVCLYCGSEITL